MKGGPPPSSLAVARHAMGTRFEILLQSEAGQPHLRAAAEEALDEIDRLDQRLSLYRATSEINHINTRASREPVLVSREVFNLLAQACDFSQRTAGAFDITIGPLMRCWGFMRDTGQLPAPEAIQKARDVVGSHLLLLDEEARTVRFSREGMMIDLGALGKGYALDCAANVLRELGLAHALLHGGTSSVLALGPQITGEPWRIAIDPPELESQQAGEPVAVAELSDNALSVSAIWGKAFEADGEIYGHIIDPRTGAPTQAAVLAAIVSDSAMNGDTLSTAVLTGGTPTLEYLRGQNPELKALVAVRQRGVVQLHRTGL